MMNDNLPPDLEQLWARAREGDAAAIEEVFNGLQSAGPIRAGLMPFVHAETGRAHRVGLAGPPRAGKSTLLTQLAGHHAQRSERVGIVSVDATGGGAASLLGERMKMNALEMSDDILVRSVVVGPQSEDPALLAGLVADGMDALGCDVVLLESVGMGRAQLDVVRRSDTVVLLVPPDVGEPERLLEAGLLATADVVAVNMIELEGAEGLRRVLEDGASKLEVTSGEWRPRILGTSALRGQGIDTLVTAIREHRTHLTESGELDSRRQRAARAQLLGLVLAAARERIVSDPGFTALLEQLSTRIREHRLDAATAAADLAARIDLPKA